MENQSNDQEANVQQNYQQQNQQDDQQIRISSDGSLPNLQDARIKSFESKQFELFDKMIQSIPDKLADEVLEKPIFQQSKLELNTKGQNFGIIALELQRKNIIKQAEMQRIGGTYDFFANQIGKYGYHMQARKNLLNNIQSCIGKTKVLKCPAFKMLIQYFKAYASLSQNFHEKCCKLEVPPRQQSQNILANLKMQLKSGFQQIISLIQNAGNDMNRIDKFIKATTLPKIEKEMQIYGSTVKTHQSKVNINRQDFENKQKKFIKRIDKISKLYTKGRIGSDVQEDLFIEMAKFVREEKQLRQLILNWGISIFNFRKDMIKADYIFFSQLQCIIEQYKNFNDTIYQLRNKQSNFTQTLKEQIQQNYQYQKLCSPLDNDYLLSIVSFKNKSPQTILRQQDYEQFLNQQYFGEIVGDPNQLLKGTLIKTFSSKFPDEELIRTISGNLIYYNNKSLQMIKQMKVVNTTAQFQGDKCVILKQTVKGLLFDNQQILKIYFEDNNRAEELVLYLSASFGNDLD